MTSQYRPHGRWKTSTPSFMRWTVHPPNVVKTTVFVDGTDNYDAINRVYDEYMSKPYSTRSAIEVSDLSINIGVKIEVVASY